MRVIAGKYRSRPLRSLRGMDIRPTSDRLRESVFDILEKDGWWEQPASLARWAAKPKGSYTQSSTVPTR